VHIYACIYRERGRDHERERESEERERDSEGEKREEKSVRVCFLVWGDGGLGAWPFCNIAKYDLEETRKKLISKDKGIEK